MENLQIKDVVKHFNMLKKYTSNPPEEKTLGWVLHYINKKDYKSILVKFGIRYLLIVLVLLENREDYEECRVVVNIIEEHCNTHKVELATHLRQIEK